MTKKSKILIVEDDKSLLTVLVKKFSKEGYEVFSAGNGKVGYDLALVEHPDMILLDIAMPVMDGITMLDSLRRDDWGKAVKVIILTNLSDNIQVSKALEVGAHDYLVKTDWKIEDVVAKVRENLN